MLYDKHCTYILDNGQRCGAWAMTDNAYCFSHDPGNIDKRLLASSKGGLARSVKVNVPLEVIPIATPKDVVILLASTINEVREGRIDLRAANTIGYLATALIKALEVAEIEAKVKAVSAILLSREANNKERSGK